MKQKILYGLLALVVSFGLWLYVITVENPNSEMTFYNIEVVLENESALTNRGLMVLNDKTPKVTLKVSGNRSHLNKLNSSNITLVADLSGIHDSGEQAIPYTITFPGDIPQNSIEILSQLPAQIGLTIVERDSKDVPVNVVTTGKVAEGFMPIKNNMTQSHQTIHVAGPASLVNEIYEARVTVDIDGAKEHINQTFRYTFYDKNGNVISDSSLTAEASEIKVSLPIQRYKEIPVVLGNVIAGGGASPNNTNIDWDVKSILVAGNDQLLNSLQFVSLGNIDLGAVAEDMSLTINLYDLLPDGVTITSGIEQVTISIDLPNLVTKILSFTSANFQPQNLPEGLTVKFLEMLSDVKFRGEAADMARLDASRVIALVDFSNAEVGTDSYKVTFDLSDFRTVGVMTGNYVVNVEVKAAPAQ